MEFKVQRREFLDTLSQRCRDGVPRKRVVGSGRVGVSGMFLGLGSGEGVPVIRQATSNPGQGSGSRGDNPSVVDSEDMLLAPQADLGEVGTSQAPTESLDEGPTKTEVKQGGGRGALSRAHWFQVVWPILPGVTPGGHLGAPEVRYTPAPKQKKKEKKPRPPALWYLLSGIGAPYWIGDCQGTGRACVGQWQLLEATIPPRAAPVSACQCGRHTSPLPC